MPFDPRVYDLVTIFLSENEGLYTEYDVNEISERLQKFLEEEIEELIKDRKIEEK